MAAADLLWIDCNEPSAARKYEVTAAARQHVMLNYIAKQQPIQSSKSRGPDGRRLIEEKDESDDSSSSSKRRSPHRRPSHALKGKGCRLKRSIAPSSSTKIPLASSINPALVLAEDSEIYQAAWWHSLNLCSNTQTNDWISTCRSQWGQGFWEFAREDGTLREIFMSYAAAKEASVRSLTDSKAYFVHKGRAMRLVAEDLKREGKDLRIAAVATICLLAKATFIEEEYEAGEAHVGAIKAVVEGRLSELPSFLWLFVIWADLRLTGVNSRAPVLDYAVHPDFEGMDLPKKMTERAKFLGSCNLIGLPEMKFSGVERTALLFRRLHELALVYNSPNGTEWPPVWVVTYDAAWMLASMKHEVQCVEEARGEKETPYDPEKLILHAASIQMWSTVSQFVPQPGFLRYALDEITKALSHLDPTGITSHWLSSSGDLPSLLWLLFSASAAAIKLTFTGHLSPSTLPHWLWLTLQHTTCSLSITTAAEFEEALRPFPFADNWNGRMSKVVWLWLKTGFVLPDKVEKKRRRAFFADFRLTFDVDVDGRLVDEKRGFETAQRAYDVVLRGVNGDEVGAGGR